MFLTIDDYKSVCDDFEFEQVTHSEAERLTAERAAMEQIGSYTRHRYDMDKAFAAVGDDRNAMLVQCMVNITLYLMIHRLPQNMGARAPRVPLRGVGEVAARRAGLQGLARPPDIRCGGGRDGRPQPRALRLHAAKPLRLLNDV